MAGGVDHGTNEDSAAQPSLPQSFRIHRARPFEDLQLPRQQGGVHAYASATESWSESPHHARVRSRRHIVPSAASSRASHSPLSPGVSVSAARKSLAAAESWAR